VLLPIHFSRVVLKGIAMRKSQANMALLLAASLAALWAAPVSAAQVSLDVSLDSPTMLAGKKQMAYVKVGLTGFTLESAEKRAPVNVAIVLDKSGSMQGDKLARARE